MITGEIKSKVDRIWDTLWSGGISNPLTIIEQLTYLLFIKRLDEIHTLKENKANRLRKPIEDPIFTPKQDSLRWSRFKESSPEDMFATVRDHEREDDTPVHKAMREALVNALVHADYSAPISILVVKAPAYFGFRNPGKMRIPIEKALEGGHSDSRNRSLQKMFSLIGLGEQAGSGIPRVLENWKSQHYRIPEMWESDEPEATLMRLRTVSLLPESTLKDLRDLFGKSIDQLDENGRLALATAHIEGFVTNGRLKQISRLHPRDITLLLKGLVDHRMLVPDGQGRATSYRLAGTEAVDLASAVDLDSPPPRSEDLDPRSEDLMPGSEHYDPVGDPILQEMALPVSSKGKAKPEVVRSTLLELCSGRFLTLNELATLVNRSPVDLRQRFIKPMVDEEKILERRYPQQPNHEQQAYRTRDP